MCGRFAITTRRLQRLEQLLKTEFPDMTERYNIAPTQPIPVIREVDGYYSMTDMRWGLVPSWSKTPTTTYSTFNAKIETVAEKPLYRSAFKHRRCLIPASGFYEWRTENGLKQPYYFTRQDDAEMALAGLWEEWKGPDGTMLQSCSILVGAANSLVGAVHDRMATIVPDNHVEDWLNPNENTDYLLAILTPPFPADKMKSTKVSSKVNAVRNQGPELLLPTP